MLAARLCSMGAPSRAALSMRGFTKPTQIQTPLARLYAQDTRSGFSRHAARRRTLKETVMSPSSGAPFQIGQGAVAGAAVVGMGALAYYGLGLSNEAGAVDRQVMWEPYVKERIRDTYVYFGGSIVATAASAAAIFRSPAAMNLVMRQGWVALGVTIVAMIGSGMVARSLPYQEAPSAKQLAWLVHCAVIGAVVAPVCLMGGAIVTRAAWYTAGMVGGLSTVAACAPSDKFLNWGGPLAMGLGVVFCASLGTMFLPPQSAMGAGLASVAIYGGLVLFGMFLLYDTQKIIHRAERHPVGYGAPPFDPVNASMGIYMDTINIFIRIATILGMNKRK